MKIKYFSINFNQQDFPHLQQEWQELEFTKWELLVAAFTVGRKSRWDIFSHGPYSGYEMLYRSGLILANLKTNKEGYIEPTNAFKGLDPSEKSAVSYFIGLTISKLMADKLLDIPYLMHLEVYQDFINSKYGPIVYNPSKSRPDLIGFDMNLSPFIFEAKGRSSSFDKGALLKAKQQACMIKSIGRPAIPPRASIAIQTFFQDVKEMRVKWEDPLPNKDGLHYDFVKPVDIIKKYYSPFVDLIDKFDYPYSYFGYHSVYLPLLDINMYIPKVIVDLYFTDNITEFEVSNIFKAIPNDIEIVLPNGNIIDFDEEFTKGNLEDYRQVMMKDKIIYEFGKTWKGKFDEEF